MTEDRTSAEDTVRPRSRGRLLRRFVFHCLGWAMALTIIVGASVYFLIGQTVRAPDWVQERFEKRLEERLSGLQVGFSDIEFVLRKGWRPRIRLRDMTLEGPEGRQLAQLGVAEAELAMRPLLKGSVQPKRIYLEGALATVRRDRYGNLSVLFNDGAQLAENAENIPALIDEWTQLLHLPQLSALTRIEVAGLSLAYEDQLQGRNWTLDGGRIQLDRAADNLRLSASFSLLSGGAFASLIEANYASQIGQSEADFGISVRDIPAVDVASQAVALSWLGVLRARISGSLRGSVGQDGALGEMSATLQISEGALQPGGTARPVPFDGARSYFTYDPVEQILEFNELSVSSPWGAGAAEGHAYLGGMRSGQLDDLIGQFTFSNLRLNPRDTYETPLELDRATAEFRLELNPFRLTLGQMYIDDGDGGLSLSGMLAAEEAGWSMALDGQVAQISRDRLLEIWPVSAAAKPRAWVASNLKAATLRGLNLALRVRPGQRAGLLAEFKYENAEVRFLKTMPPISNATGHATLIDRRFVVTATSGEVVPETGGAVDVSGTSFIIPDIGIRRAAPGVVRFAGEGSITGFLSLLNRPPLRVLRDTPFDAALAQGRAIVTGTMSLPLKQRVAFPEIDFHLEGDLTQVTSDVLVPGFDLNAGALRITGDQNGISLSGVGAIDALPADVAWRQPIGVDVDGSSRVMGTVELSPRLIETFNITLPDGMVRGLGQGEFTLDLRRGEAPKLSFSSDLKGVELRVPELGWRKAEDREALFEMDAVLGAELDIQRVALDAPGLNAIGRIDLKPDGDLERLALSNLRVGQWLNARVDLIGRGAAAPAVRILSGWLDMRSADFGSGGSSSGSAGSSPLSVVLDRLQVTDTIALNQFTGSFVSNGGLNGDFQGRVNGQTPVTGQMVPQNGRSAIRLRAEDAGGVFRSAGILQQGRGGDFDLTLVPAEGAGQFDGQLRVTNTRIKDAPAMAALLNAISVIGLFDEMLGQGILFTEVDARFLLGPSELTLMSSSAVGPSMGISMDGKYDVQNGTLDMEGVISPVYILNAIGSVLTRKGEGLLGFNYALRGSTQEPTVSINPLSALAPGGLREVFRAPQPRTPDTTTPTWRRAPDPNSDTAEGR
ncbi:MAG: AsmA-like C-terminal region-containing protein [Arenibacterium sp.]